MAINLHLFRMLYSYNTWSTYIQLDISFNISVVSNWLKHFNEIYTVSFLPRQNIALALFSVSFTAQIYTQRPLCFGWKRGFHMCWSRRFFRQYQTQPWSYMKYSRLHCYQECRFLLWSGLRRCTRCWTLPCYSCHWRRRQRQSVKTTCYDPVK